ncbi:MAG: hypothetical protein ACOZQL_42085 [Myxococcota bacterium]
MGDLFLEGGWTMYPTMLFGALMLGVSGLIAARPERRFVPLLLSLGGLSLFSGFLGTMWGLTGMVKAFANAAPADVRTIMTACATQALNSLLLAALLVTLSLVGAALGAVRVARGWSVSRAA